MSVSSLGALIDGALKDAAPKSVRVTGEVSGFRERTHWYFDLKDDTAVIGGVVFASSARRMDWVPENGQQVVATGRLEFYAPGGRVSLVITRLEPVGMGSLDAQFRKLVAELRGLGWFDPDRKRALPMIPRRIAVVTSSSGAALQDVRDTVSRRFPSVVLSLLDARVQGPSAAGEVVRAIRWASEHAERREIDAVLVTRGGGSMEDLWCFNEREVARAVLECSVPVVCAIGHETDTTIAELVADVRAATPTQAAMLLTPDRDALREEVASRGARLRSLMAREARSLRDRVRSAMARPSLSRPDRMFHGVRAEEQRVRSALASEMHRTLNSRASKLSSLRLRLARQSPATVAVRDAERMRARLGEATSQLRGAMTRRLDSARRSVDDARLIRVGTRLGVVRRERLAGVIRELQAVGPGAVLARGFSITELAGGRLLRSASDAKAGDVLRTRLADGSLTSVVGEQSETPAPTRKAGGATKPKRSGRERDARDQLDLFGNG